VAADCFGPKAMTALLVQIRLLYLTVFLTLVTDPQRVAMGMALLGPGWNESSTSPEVSSSTALVKQPRPRGANAKRKD